MLHKDPIEVGAVDAGVAGGVRNADRIGIIIFQVFFCFCKILQRGLGIRFRGCFLHERKKKQKMSGGSKQIGWILRKGFQQAQHLSGKGGNTFRIGVPEDYRIGKDSVGEQLGDFSSVKSDPGIAPGIGFVCLIVGDLYWRNEKSIALGECVGYAPVLINSAAAQDDMEKIMRSHCRTVKVAGLAVFAVAEIDGEWGLRMRCMSGHFGDSLFIE